MKKEEELLRIKKLQKALHKERTFEDSKNRLKDIAMKKFRTCFIFALSEFEETFGHDLWGHNTDEDCMTDEQLLNREKWKNIRTNILNKGNTQARALMSEIDLHKIEFEGYRTFLKEK